MTVGIDWNLCPSLALQSNWCNKHLKTTFMNKYENQLVLQTRKYSWCYKHKNTAFMIEHIGWYSLASLALSLSKPTPGRKCIHEQT